MIEDLRVKASQFLEVGSRTLVPCWSVNNLFFDKWKQNSTKKRFMV